MPRVISVIGLITTTVLGFADAPLACGPHALGVHISKIPHSHGITSKRVYKVHINQVAYQTNCHIYVYIQ